MTEESRSSLVEPAPPADISETALLERGAMLERGWGLHRAGRMAEAVPLYQAILAQDPTDPGALHYLGLAALQTQRFAQGVALIEQARARDAGNATLLNNLAHGLRMLGRHEAALAACDQALARKPNLAAALQNRALILRALNQPDDALAAIDRAIAVSPGMAEMHVLRGELLSLLGRAEDALASQNQAIGLQPAHATALRARADLLAKAGRNAEALAAFDTAIACDPGQAEVWNGRGIVYCALDRHEAALADFNRAIALDPGEAASWNNRGNALGGLRRHVDALLDFDRALALRPGYADAAANMGIHLLQIGRYEHGWFHYEARKRRDNAVGERGFAQPLWLGRQAIAGRTIFLHSEQGLGDTLQFARYADVLAGQGAQVILGVQQGLCALLRQWEPRIRVMPEGDLLPRFDLHCPLLSLPLACGTTLETIPPPPALRAPATLRDAWQARLGPARRMRVGLVWSGNPAYGNDRNRSIRLDLLAPLLAMQVDFVCLQRDIAAPDQAALAARDNFVLFPGELTDFCHTAALVEAVDLVISVDTSVAHLAGSMGKPVWVMLPYHSDWRWLLDRPDTPWYSSARLFRQSALGNWAAVVDDVVASLRNIL